MNKDKDNVSENIVVTNPIKAIRKHCLDCCGGNSNEVKLCTVERCYLYPFRFGKNPYRTVRVLTEDQKAAMVERLAIARQSKQS